MKDRKPCRFETTHARGRLRFLLITALVFLASGVLGKSEEKSSTLSKSVKAIEAKIDKASGHYCNAQYAEVVNLLDGVDKEIDALVAKHGNKVGEWMPTARKAIVYAMLAASHKKQSERFEALYDKGWGKVVGMDEFLSGVLRDMKPQIGVELSVSPASVAANDAYGQEDLTFKEIRSDKNGTVQITFTARPESLYFCPGANAKTTDKGIELTFVRSSIRKRPKVTYPAKSVEKGKVISVTAKDKPVFWRDGKELIKMFPRD